MRYAHPLAKPGVGRIFLINTRRSGPTSAAAWPVWTRTERPPERLTTSTRAIHLSLLDIVDIVEGLYRLSQQGFPDWPLIRERYV
jgi:hypothetical protein